MTPRCDPQRWRKGLERTPLPGPRALPSALLLSPPCSHLGQPAAQQGGGGARAAEGEEGGRGGRGSSQCCLELPQPHPPPVHFTAAGIVLVAPCWYV
jgi:hypothetical protein